MPENRDNDDLSVHLPPSRYVKRMDLRLDWIKDLGNISGNQDIC